MELNYQLPQQYLSLLDEKTEYCAPCDLSLDGGYTSDVYVCVTRSALLVITDGKVSRQVNFSDCSGIRHINQINCGLLVAVMNGTEHVLAKYSMKHVARFAYIARGAELLRQGQFDKKIQSDEPERTCNSCGRALPGTMDCPKCHGRGTVLRRFLKTVKPFTPMLVLIFSVMGINSAADIGMQFVFRYFLDYHLIPQTGTVYDIFRVIAIMVGVSAAGLVSFLARDYFCSRLGTGMQRDLRNRLGIKIQQLSLSFINKKEPGVLMDRITGDTRTIREFMERGFCYFVSQGVTMIAIIVVMFVLNWRLALIMMVCMPVIWIAVRIYKKRIHRMFHSMWRKQDKAHSKLQDVLSGIRVVKTFGKEADEIKKFNALNKEFAEMQTKTETFWANFNPLMGLIIMTGTYVIVYVGGADILRGTSTPGELMQFLVYSAMLLGSLRWMTFFPRQLITTITSLERIYDVLDEVPDVKQSKKPVNKTIRGDIHFKNVSFGYKSFEPVIEDISLHVKSGEMIGLVGPSGAGKSTLINLVMRLYDVDDGSITIDDVNIKEFDGGTFHSQIGAVLQEAFLFSGTVLNNIRFSRPDCCMEEIILAAKRANAHDFICKLPDGYNTYVGERGHTLSGGERQRISIARAILNNPRILILDEATSALDTESEYQVSEALNRLREGRTTFAIAHRLSTLRSADRIMVIDDHRCAEVGTHNELLRKKGIYYNLVMAQLQMNKAEPKKG